MQNPVIALGAGLGIWGVTNLLESYGDNPGRKFIGHEACEALLSDTETTQRRRVVGFMKQLNKNSKHSRDSIRST